MLAQRLEKAGLPTLFAVLERVNGIGARWWQGVPGIGRCKGGRIVEWLREHEAMLSLRVSAHVAIPRTQLGPAMLAAVVAPATALVPWEKFIVPAALDGSTGRYRAPPEQCLLQATNDYEAIEVWLAAKGSSHSGPGTSLTATQRAYRREAERLLLWAVLERGKPLSSLAVDDASAYRDFLAAPPASWCGPRHHQRWSPRWRPLKELCRRPGSARGSPS